MPVCSHCKMADMYQEDGKKYAECPDCGAIEMLYAPQPYQYQFHQDPTRYKGLFGG